MNSIRVIERQHEIDMIEGEAKHKAELERIKSESQYNTSELKEKLERLDIIVKNQEATKSPTCP